MFVFTRHGGGKPCSCYHLSAALSHEAVGKYSAARFDWPGGQGAERFLFNAVCSRY